MSRTALTSRQAVQARAALDGAIKHMGGPVAMARALQLSGYQVVQQWREHRVPAEHCPRIERLTGTRCELLRPDVEWNVLRVGACACACARAAA